MLKQFLKDQLQVMDIALCEDQIDQLMAYVHLLEKWNKTYNLTAIRDPKEMIIKHILDSLAIVPYLQSRSFIDVGTGAGLPGIPLAIANPNCEFTLLDSLGKRIRFLTQVKASLKLENVQPVQARVEAFNSAQFDGVISRAFASLSEMLRLCAHLINENGLFYALKGDIQSEEIEQIPLGFQVKSQVALMVPQLNATRFLLLIEKIKD